MDRNDAVTPLLTLNSNMLILEPPQIHTFCTKSHWTRTLQSLQNTFHHLQLLSPIFTISWWMDGTLPKEKKQKSSKLSRSFTNQWCISVTFQPFQLLEPIFPSLRKSVMTWIHLEKGYPPCAAWTPHLPVFWPRAHLVSATGIPFMTTQKQSKPGLSENQQEIIQYSKYSVTSLLLGNLEHPPP